MRSTWFLAAALLVVGAAIGPGAAQAIPETWHKSMDEGLEAAAKEAEGWTLLRFDLADEDQAFFAATLGIVEAPAMLMWLAGAERPTAVKKRVTGPGLAAILKRNKTTIVVR